MERPELAPDLGKRCDFDNEWAHRDSNPQRRCSEAAHSRGAINTAEVAHSGIAGGNRPSATGLPVSAPIEIPPADSPATVTLSGSPPKAAMLFRTQRSAAI